MKTSKLILFSYIGLLAFAFLIFVIFLKATDQERRAEQKIKIETHQVGLPSFTHVKVDRQNTEIKCGDTNMATVYYHKDSVCPDILWEKIGDTLLIKKSDQYSQLKIVVNSTVSLHVESQGGKVSFNKLKIDSLFLNGTKATFNGFDNSEVDYVYANLMKSRVQSYSGQFNNAEMNLTSSNIYISKPMISIRGKAAEKSEFRIRKVHKIDLEMDESSNLRCN